MCGRITMCKCTKFYNKTTYFYLKARLHWKGNILNFWLYSTIFFTQFDLNNTIFQSLCSQIFKFGSFLFDQLEAAFHANFYAYNHKPLFRSAETSFFQLIGTSLVENVGFSLRNVNKTKNKQTNKKNEWKTIPNVTQFSAN